MHLHDHYHFCGHDLIVLTIPGCWTIDIQSSENIILFHAHSMKYCIILFILLPLWITIILQKQLMIVGIDVYHDSTFGQKKSVVGFVASTNRYVPFVLHKQLTKTGAASLTSLLHLFQSATITCSVAYRISSKSSRTSKSCHPQNVTTFQLTHPN